MPAGESACSPLYISSYMREYDPKEGKLSKGKSSKKSVTTPRDKPDKPSHNSKFCNHGHSDTHQSRETACIANAALSSDTQRTRILNMSRYGLKLFECPSYESLLLPLSIVTVNLSYNELSTIPTVLHHLPDLRYLNLSNNAIKVIQVKDTFQELQSLELSANPIVELPKEETVQNFPKLNELCLRETNIKVFSAEDVRCMSQWSLKQLDLSNNELASLPENIGDLTSLESLDVSRNILKSVPSSLANLTNINVFNIRDNCLHDPPQELAEKGGIAAIKRYVLLRGDAVWVTGTTQQTSTSGSSSNQYKLIVVGNERQGKTSVVQRLTHHTVSVGKCRGRLLSRRSDKWEIALLDDDQSVIETDREAFEVVEDVGINQPVPESTIGIDLHHWRLGLMDAARCGESDIEDVALSVWDFAGQEIYHAAQEVFFSNHALYMVVWDMTKNSPQDFDDYVQFWIDLIQSRCPGSTILFVGTNADKFTSNEEIENICLLLNKHLKEAEEKRVLAIEERRERLLSDMQVGRASHLDKLLALRPRRKWIIPVSCITGVGINEVTSRVVELSTPTNTRPHPFQLVNIRIPHYYEVVKERIAKYTAEGNLLITINKLHQDLVTSISEEYAIDITRDAVTFLACVGEVVWFGSYTMKNFSTPASSPSSCIDAMHTDTWHTVEEEMESLREIVFLKPKWLLDALKSVLTHKLSDNISTMMYFVITTNGRTNKA